MLLEGRARLSIGVVVSGNIGKPDATQFCANPGPNGTMSMGESPCFLSSKVTANQQGRQRGNRRDPVVSGIGKLSQNVQEPARPLALASFWGAARPRPRAAIGRAGLG